MRVVLLGPQGAGKGTQAQRIAEATGAEHIATGDLVRAEIKSGSDLGEQIKDYNDRGELGPGRDYYRDDDAVSGAERLLAAGWLSSQ